MSQERKPRIDFYKLNGQNRTSINRFCCQLTHKVVNMGKPVFVRTKDETESRLMDDMMWTFSDNSFLPHTIQGEAEDPDAPVRIGHTPSPAECYLLINLGDDLPEDLQRYERIAEIINDAPQILQQGRARYAAYQKDACLLHYHQITN